MNLRILLNTPQQIRKSFVALGLMFFYTHSHAQLNCTKLKIDSIVVQIMDEFVSLKHINADTFRAYVPTSKGYNTFLFDINSKQVCSDIIGYKRDFLGGVELLSSFSTKPSDNRMRPELYFICRGIYDGEYTITDQEKGSFKDEKLDGLIEVMKKPGGYWYGSTTYHSGQKHGVETCTNGRYTNRNTYINGKKVRLQVSDAKGLLLRDETYAPFHRLITYDNNGNLTRLEVQDSIHLYYQRNVLRFSLTYNTDKKIWESQSFYPSGQIESYQPHATFKYSPTQEAIYYNEEGKVIPEPEPEIMIDEMMEYQTIHPHYYKSSRRVYSDDDLLSLNTATILSSLDSVLSLSGVTNIKKRNTGLYSFAIETNKFSSTTVNFMYDVKDPTVSNYVKSTLESNLLGELPLITLTSHPIIYFRGSIEFEVNKP